MKSKEIIAWVILIFLLIMLIILNYVRFFGFYNYQNESEITELEVSSNEAIDIALETIVNNFNNDEELKSLEQDKTKIEALYKNYSIYIYYTDLNDLTTTYEFNYNHLTLNINIKNSEENLEKFNIIYQLLLKAIQKRINIDFNNKELIDSHIKDGTQLTGITKTVSNDEKTINYKIDITKKIEKKEGSE